MFNKEEFTCDIRLLNNIDFKRGDQQRMQIDIFTDNYKIVDSGTVLLFNGNSDMKIELVTNSDFKFSIIIQFINDDQQNKALKKEVMENTIIFKCVNFNSMGTGTTEPISIATVDNKEWLIHLWSDITGNGGPRKVEYSILEK